MMSNILDKLNDRQKEAVLTTEGPVLVLAGAGSGKTTVLVNRIAYMISQKHIKPWNILAITFTNKAANEMKERIERLLGDTAKDMWIGTFHSVCVKILRTCIDLLGYNRDFVIYDTVNETFLNAGLKKYEGDMPKIILSDLTGEGMIEMMVSLENPNKEKEVRIVMNKNNSLKEIFGAKDNKGINFTGEMIDGVKAHVRCNKLNKELYIDLTDRKLELIKNKRIDESGKIISENKKVLTSGFKTIEIVELNGQNGIQTTQLITAFDNTEIVDEITAIWKYEEGKWQIKEARGTKVGNLIY